METCTYWNDKKRKLIKDHILFYFIDNYSFKNPVTNLKNQVQYCFDSSVNNPKIIKPCNYKMIGYDMAKGGLFLIYNDEIETFLLNFYTKKQLDKNEDHFKLYCNLIGDGVSYILKEYDKKKGK